MHRFRPVPVLVLVLVLVLVPVLARAYVPVPDAWNEGIYVMDGSDVCRSVTVDADDKAVCDQIYNLFGQGGNANDLLNYVLTRYGNDDLGGDLVDTVIVMSDWDQRLGDALAFYSPLNCNEIAGTGRFLAPCAGTVSGIIDMNASDKFPADYQGGFAGALSFFDVLGQETEH